MVIFNIMFLSTRSIAALLVLSSVVAIGVIGSYILGQIGNNFNEHMDLINAIYFTITTLSTVGYGDIVPITPIAKMFVVILIIMGLGAFLTAVTSISSDLATRDIISLSEKIEKMEEELITPQILLIGSGQINVNLMKILKEKKKKYVLLVSDKIEAERFRSEGNKAYAINMLSEEEIARFHPEKAKIIVIDMNNVSDMIYVLLILSEIAKEAKIIVIVHDSDTEKRVQTIKKLKDIEIINPSSIVANEIALKL